MRKHLLASWLPAPLCLLLALCMPHATSGQSESVMKNSTTDELLENTVVPSGRTLTINGTLALPGSSGNLLSGAGGQVQIGGNLTLANGTLSASGGGGSATLANPTQAAEMTDNATAMSPSNTRTAINSDFLLTRLPRTFGLIANRTSDTPPPIRVVTFGDSLSSDLNFPAHWAHKGFFRLQAGNSTNTTFTSNYTIWPTGHWVIAAGGNCIFAAGSDKTLPGDTLLIAAVRNVGSGNVTVETSSNNEASWTASGNIVLGNATRSGLYQTYSLATTSRRQYKVRLTATGGPVEIIAVGLYQSTGPGFIHPGGILNLAGIDLNLIRAVDPNIFDPIWTGLAPDLVISLWADPPEEWEAGGGWRWFYDRMVAAVPGTDFLTISRNPIDQANDEALQEEQRVAQRAWARETGTAWIDGSIPFGGTFATANASGLMNGSIHPNFKGKLLRDAFVWRSIGTEQFPFGRTPLLGGYPPSPHTQNQEWEAVVDSVMGAYSLGATVRIRPPAGVPHIRLSDHNSELESDDASRDISFWNDERIFYVGREFTPTLGVDASRLFPAVSGYDLGTFALRWEANLTSGNFTGPIVPGNGTAAADLTITGGAVSPEGNITAKPGSIYTLGNGTAGSLWIKSSGTGNTGWTQFTAP